MAPDPPGTRADSARGPSPAQSVQSLSRTTKGMGSGRGGRAGPVGTDLPGFGGRAGRLGPAGLPSWVLGAAGDRGCRLGLGTAACWRGKGTAVGLYSSPCTIPSHEPLWGTGDRCFCPRVCPGLAGSAWHPQVPADLSWGLPCSRPPPSPTPVGNRGQTGGDGRVLVGKARRGTCPWRLPSHVTFGGRWGWARRRGRVRCGADPGAGLCLIASSQLWPGSQGVLVQPFVSAPRGAICWDSSRGSRWLGQPGEASAPTHVGRAVMDRGGQVLGKGDKHPEDSDASVLRLRPAAAPSPDMSF